MKSTAPQFNQITSDSLPALSILGEREYPIFAAKLMVEDRIDFPRFVSPLISNGSFEYLDELNSEGFGNLVIDENIWIIPAKTSLPMRKKIDDCHDCLFKI